MKISQNDRDALQRIKEQMEREPDMRFSLVSIASDAGMSRSKFQKLFYFLYKEHPYAMLKEIRMQKAYAMLEEQRWTAKEISYKVGFKHLSSFSTAFKRRFGVRASELL